MNFQLKHYIEKEDIEKRIVELGKEISKDYDGLDIKLVCILKGGAPFACDLMKHIDNPKLTIDFMSVSSYGDGTSSSGLVKINKDLDKSIEGENVIVIEDIIDTGITLHNLVKILKTRGPKTLKVCTLLDKPSRRKVDMKSDYVGFEIEDKYVAGYGLDYMQLYRHLPYVAEVVFDDV